MQMIFEIEGPAFKCAEDEKIFFERLYSLPGYESVTSSDRNLYLKLNGALAAVAIKEVKDICDFWNTTYNIMT